MRGLSEPNGSWNTICIRRRISRSSRLVAATTSAPSKRTEPEVAGSRRSTSRPVVDLPHPDSPTRPRVWPRARSNETPHTAWTWSARRPQEPRTGKCLTRSRTSSRAGAAGAAEATGVALVMA